MVMAGAGQAKPGYPYSRLGRSAALSAPAWRGARIGPILRPAAWLPAFRILENTFSMFGSNDDKKTPAEPGEKKGLFGWLRKKPQPASAEQPATEPQADSEPVEQTVANVETPAATPQHEEPRAVEADLQRLFDRLEQGHQLFLQRLVQRAAVGQLLA